MTTDKNLKLFKSNIPIMDYRKNREKYNAQRKMRYRSRSDEWRKNKNAYYRIYYQKNKGKILSRRTEHYRSQREAYRNWRINFFNSWNNECLGCGRPLYQGRFNHLHEINNVRHNMTLWGLKKNGERLIPLCGFCHYAFHRLIPASRPIEEVLLFLGWEMS